MSLIDYMMTECVIMDKRTVSDGEGGFDTEWVEGATIKVAITNDTSMPTRIAQAEGFANTYTLTTSKANALEFHDVIKRVEDGLVLRVTNDKVVFPAVASDMLNGYTQCSAEKWSFE